MTDRFTVKAYTPDQSDYEKIRAFTRRAFSADELYAFEVTLCDNEIDRDFEKFSVNSLSALQNLFVGKTGIKDHSMKAEDQTARVFDTRLEKIPGKKTADGEDYVALRAKAYMVRTPENESLIRDIDAGIKKEVSVSCSAKSRVCSVCGAEKSKEYCGHKPGGTYGGKLCYTILDDVFDAYEFSFVAVPAQRNAGVEKAFDMEKDGTMTEDILKKLRSGGTAVSDGEAAYLVQMMDELRDDAALGREYRKTLVRDLVKLCGRELPELDTEIFKRVADIMTAKELVSFKETFEKQRARREKPAPQLVRQKEQKAKGALSEFKI